MYAAGGVMRRPTRKAKTWKGLALLPVALLALIFGTPSAGTAQESQKVEGRLASLANRPGTYQALYSLPETRAHLVEAVGKDTLDRIGPGSLPESLPAEHQQRTLKAVAAAIAAMPASQQQRFWKRLENWLDAHNMLVACSGLAFGEATTSAMYAVPMSRDLFDPIVKNRGFPPDVNPAMIGETLDGHLEGTEITYELLNRLSLLKTRERVRYFRDLLEQMDKLLPEFGVKE